MPNRTRHKTATTVLVEVGGSLQVNRRNPKKTEDPSLTKCCVPSGCNLSTLIHMQHLKDSVKIICNNEQCQEGRYMHKECFEEWQESVLTFLRSSGRARSWSEKQRLQNLWTKKGYDLAYRACMCKCNKGHLRKDLDWIPPSGFMSNEESGKRKRNKRKKSSDKPSLIVSTVMSNPSVGANKQTVSNAANNGNQGKASVVGSSRLRTCSMSSTGSGGSGGTSPPISGGESQSPDSELVAGLKKLVFYDNIRMRNRHNSGSIFRSRPDYSSFNNLPRNKLNAYHIKMEDDINHGNDETRFLLLSTLSTNRANKISCSLCKWDTEIYDRYPLIDGTFFISPLKHSTNAIEIKQGGKMQYLNAVCYPCMYGWTLALRCKSCKTTWNGSHFILGSMYSYDIFAAVPCCADRLRCKNCSQLVITAENRLQFFSDYSHSLSCSHCGIVDHHFVKPLQVTYVRSSRD